MLAITHFAVGATGGVLLAVLLNVDDRNVPLAMVVSGLWAMVPDIGKPVPGIDPNALHGIEGNLFWFHAALDAAETAHGSVEGMLALAVLGLAVVAARRSTEVSA